MFNDHRFLIVIPARRNSSLKNKNTREVLGRTLIDWTIDTAQINPRVFNYKILVTTDDPKVEWISGKRDIEVHNRNKKYCTDHATLNSVMHHIAADVKPDFDSYICLQPNSPLRTKVHLERAVMAYLQSKADSCLSVTSERRSIWTIQNNSIWAYPMVSRYKNRQKCKPIFIANGSIFVSSRNVLIERKNRVGGRVTLYEMDYVSSLDIHDSFDLERANLYLKHEQLIRKEAGY